MAGAKKVFSEKEASEVLRRASRLQEERGGAYSPALTYEEILRIASEAGIDSENVAAAIQAAPQKHDKFGWVDEDERVLDVELDPSDFDVVSHVAKSGPEGRRTSRQLGRTLKLGMYYGRRSYTVEVTSRNGRTRIHVARILFIAYLWTLNGIILALGGGALLLDSGRLAVAAAFVPIVLVAVVLAFAATIHKGRGKASELADLIEARIRETVDASPRGT